MNGSGRVSCATNATSSSTLRPVIPSNLGGVFPFSISTTGRICSTAQPLSSPAKTGTSGKQRINASTPESSNRSSSSVCTTPRRASGNTRRRTRSEEHTSELQSRVDLVCRLLLEKKNQTQQTFL